MKTKRKYYRLQWLEPDGEWAEGVSYPNRKHAVRIMEFLELHGEETRIVEEEREIDVDAMDLHL